MVVTQWAAVFGVLQQGAGMPPTPVTTGRHPLTAFPAPHRFSRPESRGGGVQPLLLAGPGFSGGGDWALRGRRPERASWPDGGRAPFVVIRDPGLV